MKATGERWERRRWREERPERVAAVAHPTAASGGNREGASKCRGRQMRQPHCRQRSCRVPQTDDRSRISVSPKILSGTATGIVRRVDDLGRIVIPKEIRRTLKIREGDPLYTTLTPIDRFCWAMNGLIHRITAE